MSPSANSHFPAMEQNVEYYNQVSADYDGIMADQPCNQYIREKVASRFRELVPRGWVLDFGGGTGQDMDWMAAAGYKIIFCEPSRGMREKAMRRNFEKLQYPDILFLDDARSDFTSWDQEPAFPLRLDGVLSNFAVFNNISDLPRLFASLARVTKSGAPIIALVLEEGREGALYLRIRKKIRSILSGQRAAFQVRHQGFRQTVFLHTGRAMRKAAAEAFLVQPAEKIPESPFQLIHLTRK